MKYACMFGAAVFGFFLFGHFFQPEDGAPSFLLNTKEETSKEETRLQPEPRRVVEPEPSKTDTTRLDAEVNVPPEAIGVGIDLVVSHGRMLHFDEPVKKVFIAEPAIADITVVDANTIYIMGKKIGTTNLIAIAGDGNTAEDAKMSGPAGVGTLARPAADRPYIEEIPETHATIRVRVVADLQPTYDAIGSKDVKIHNAGPRVVIQGPPVKDPSAAGTDGAVITAITGQPPIDKRVFAGSQQVNLRVRFAEVSRSDLQTLGINWHMINAGDFSLGSLSGSGQHHIDTNALLDGLQRNGTIHVLAEPNLTAVTGQTASFLAGGEALIPVSQGGGTVTTASKTFGVSLVFTPTLITQNRISLHVHPEVSTLSMTTGPKVGGVELPVLLVRRMDTTVELASGQTFALGGLFQRQLSQSAEDMDKLMLVSDLPVIGSLFRSPRFRRNESELVILVTAYLVNPISNPGNAVTPLDRPEPPPPQQVQTKKQASGPGMIW